MNLLFQTIQEYLAEHHPLWMAAQDEYSDSVIHITNPGKPLERIIRVFTDNQFLVSGNHYGNTDYTIYTDYTLLTQITKFINHAEKSLLQQAIQEYIKEHHPNWKMLSADDGIIYLGLKTTIIKGGGYSIVIYTTEQTIENFGRFCMHYTDNTILSLITEAINHVEKPWTY